MFKVWTWTSESGIAGEGDKKANSKPKSRMSIKSAKEKCDIL